MFGKKKKSYQNGLAIRFYKTNTSGEIGEDKMYKDRNTSVVYTV